MNDTLVIYVRHIKTNLIMGWFDRLDRFLRDCEGADLDILLTLLVQTLPWGEKLPAREMLLQDSRIEDVLRQKLSCLK